MIQKDHRSHKKESTSKEQKKQNKINKTNSERKRKKKEKMNKENEHQEMKGIHTIIPFFVSQMEEIVNEIEEYHNQREFETFEEQHSESLKQQITRAESILDRSLLRIDRVDHIMESHEKFYGLVEWMKEKM